MKTLYITLSDPEKWPRPLLAQKALGAKNVVIKYINVPYHLKIRAIEKFVKFLKICSSLNFGTKSDVIICLNPYPLRKIDFSFFHRRPFVVDYMDVRLDENEKLGENEKEILEGAEGIIFWSKAQMELASRQLDISNYTYVPAGINLHVFNKVRDIKGFKFSSGFNQEKLVTYFGYSWQINGREVQGVRDLIEAMTIVEKESKNVRLIISGPVLDEYLRQVVKEAGIRKISFFGSVPYGSFEFLNRLDASDVLVLPTTSYPTVFYAEQHKLFIYMATRKPIVATATPGTRGVLDASTAIFAEPDDPESLANAIVRALSDSQYVEKIANNAYGRLVEKYTWDKLAPKYYDFVVRCLAA